MGIVVNLTLSAALAVGSFVLFKWWLITPNYNSLTLQALLLAGSGLLLAERYASKCSILGWGLVGIAGWLAFMSKPTTAAALALLITIYFLCAGKLRFRLLLIPVLVAIFLSLATAWVLDGSILGFVSRYKMGANAAQILIGSHGYSNLFRWDELVLTTIEKQLLAISSFFVFITVCLSSVKSRILNLIGYGLVLLAMLASIAIIAGIYILTVPPSQFLALVTLGVPTGVIVASIVLVRAGLLSISRNHWALAACFLIFPYAYAFGTSNNYSTQQPTAAIFWILSSIVLLAPIAANLSIHRFLLPIIAVTQITVVILVNAAMEHPYRQPQPLAQNSQVVLVGIKNTAMVLSSGFAQYFNNLKKTASDAGFTPDTPMIDLTGQSPTTLFALGARAIGAPWMIGGYPGSDQFAITMLNGVPCNEISRAWLLAEPNGPNKLSPIVLNHFGAKIEHDYIIVGKITIPSGAGGYAKPREQLLLKPNSPIKESLLECEQSKTEEP